MLTTGHVDPNLLFLWEVTGRARPPVPVTSAAHRGLSSSFQTPASFVTGYSVPNVQVTDGSGESLATMCGFTFCTIQKKSETVAESQMTLSCRGGKNSAPEAALSPQQPKGLPGCLP